MVSLIEAIEFGVKEIADYYFKKNKDDIIYTLNNGSLQFHLWNGDLWKPHDDNMMKYEIVTFLQNDLMKEQRLSDAEKKKKINKLSGRNIVMSILDNVKAQAVKHTEKSRLMYILDSSRDNINYTNGLLDLRTGVFRKRDKTDYITRCLDYCYDTDKSKYEKEMQHINRLYKSVCNDNDEMYEFKKSLYGYFLTGETKECKFVIECGLGGNGKSFMVETFEAVFGIYVEKLGNKTFCANYEKSHKYIIGTIGKRFIYVEEMCADKANCELIKDIVNGSKIVVEKMFGTREKFDSQAKLVFIGNKPPEFPTDDGIGRRGIVCEYRNKFVDEGTKVNEKKGVYLANKDIKYLFDKENYKNALIHILLPYSMKYYKEGKLVVPDEYRNLFKDLCDENDIVKIFIDDLFVITNDSQDKISKDDFTRSFNQYNNENRKFIHLIQDVKRLGITYKKDLRVDGKKGVICGIRFKNDNDDDNYDNDNGAISNETKAIESSKNDNEINIEEIKKPTKKINQKGKPAPKELGVKIFGKHNVEKTKPQEEEESNIDFVEDALNAIKIKKQLSINFK